MATTDSAAAASAGASAAAAAGAPQHLNIVALETIYSPLPDDFGLPAPHTYSLTAYARSTPADLPARLADADIAIITIIPITAALLDPAVTPRLRLIAVLASGTDTIDLAACRARGVRVVNCPNCNQDAVAEHAVALYFACRRSLVGTMRTLRTGVWPARVTLMGTVDIAGRPPRGCRAETAVIVGYGGVGRRVAALFRGMGMKIVVAGRKGADAVAADRTPFADALRTATVLVLCCPRTPDTLGLLSAAEFATLRDDCILVNVARGGVVDEQALLAALQDGRLGGAGVDVYAKEPAAPETSPLLGPAAAEVNLVTTPHTAWIGADTMANYHRLLLENVRGIVTGELNAESVVV